MQTDVFGAPGIAAASMRAVDWSQTTLGPADGWSASLKTIVQMMLRSRFAMWMAWGPDLTFFCNDAYLPTLGIKQAWAIGARSDKVWEEIWPDIGPRIAHVFQSREATWDEDLLLFLERSGYSEETYHTFSYSPLSNDDGIVEGMLCVVTEVTERVIAERRVATLRDLAAKTANARSVEEACARSMEALAVNPQDFPYAMIRLFDEDRLHGKFMAGWRISPENPVIQDTITIAEWPRISKVLEARAVIAVPLTDSECDALPRGPWRAPIKQACIAPMFSKTQRGPSGFFVAGVNPHRVFDAGYRDFVDLVAGHVAAAIANANAFEEERKRAEALAAIDQAKTAFFSNVSHEFRTPLTLMLGPLEDFLRDRPDEKLAMAQRNGLRLMRLVNTLLDFSRAEAGRARAHFEATDLSALTADLASSFRSAFERAGLSLVVDCQIMETPIDVDRDMWEKIVLNLLSNAFKFTFAGSVSITLLREDEQIVLRVSDTGVGIPETELARIFERFHRIEGQLGRTYEGTGIGLALVNDLVGLHGGSIDVTSKLGQGTVFAVRIPARTSTTGVGRKHDTHHARSYVEEALRWLPDEAQDAAPETDASAPAEDAGRILLADDNADMRRYVSRLLQSAGYRVAQAADGEQALDLISQSLPDLILSDVMMPKLDGLALVQRLKADAGTAMVPIILLSARFGEEAEIEGLDSGADDYITKPFAGKELLARVRQTIKQSRQRAAMLQQADSARTQLRLVIDALPALVSYVDREERYRLNNKAYTDWFGRATHDIEGKTIQEVLGPNAYDLHKPHILSALSGQTARFESVVPSRQGGERHIDATYLPDKDEAGRVNGFFVFVNDVSERRRKDAALVESEVRFRSMADNAPVMIWVTEADGLCSYLSSRWYEFTGQTEAEGLGLGWLNACHPDDRARSDAIFRAANDRREAFSLEYRLRRADGEYRWCIDAASPRLGPDGEFLGYIGSVIDITERKHAEDRRILLINELNHRVKNTLAVVQSLASQGLRASPENTARFKEVFVQRLAALAHAHDLLTQSNWAGAEFADVAVKALSAFASPDRYVARGPCVRVPPRAAVPLSMALHELATNAAKYGALSSENGTVTLEWRVGSRDNTQVLDILWVENGGPAVSVPQRRGFGSRLIEQGLRHELDAEINLDFEPTGLRCRIVFPLTDAKEESAPQ